MEGIDSDVSICIANYNMEDTISESLDSVLDNIPKSYEIVIVDESDDGSREVIESTDFKNPIKRIYVSNLGFHASINRAVEESSGDIVITHVDMDDWYDSRYFEPFVNLYSHITNERNGEDFWLSCPNFNITARNRYLNRYKLEPRLPMGAGEREYKWRLIMSGEYLNVDIDEKISGRIKLSERKDIRSRAERTFGLVVGLFQIKYTVRRIIKEEVLRDSRSTPAKLFTLIIIPFAYAVARYRPSVDSDVPGDGKPLSAYERENTYTLSELEERYNIESHANISSLASSE